MHFLAIIPARYASSRFPGKPLADIDGKPMIQRVYERVSEYYKHCCVATDDERIERAVRGFGGKVVMTSDKHRSGTDRCAEALGHFEKESGLKFDVVVNVQGDEPFVSEEHLVKIKTAFEDKETQIATLVKRFSKKEDIFNPNSPKVILSKDGFALYFSRAAVPYLRNVPQQSDWQSQYVYFKHIGLYAYRCDVLREITLLPMGELEKAESLEQLRWIENGYRIKAIETVAENIAVDTPEDLQAVLRKIRG